ncbi:RDD family protein [Trichinella spiralis]|uniref:Protein FAM8A1 n=1 Tax=Trichinella spiralis TaxID=6334 RepID=E5SH35_TRISP|nr:RDD family protein [Trichinella spiralis]KRY43540.1 Protein FAM8A1 [Trichinella spiralis]
MPELNRNSPVTNSSPTCYSSWDEYAQAVRTWLWSYREWQVYNEGIRTVLLQINLKERNLPALSSGISASAPILQNHDQQTAFPIIPICSGTPCVIPTFRRRIVAELIDYFCCLIWLILFMIILHELNFINVSHIEKIFTVESDIQSLVDLTQELVPYEIMKRLSFSFFEASYLAFSGCFDNVQFGCTPGKFVMKIRVIPCESISPGAAENVAVVERYEDNITFPRALLRSLLKNICLGFLFPLSLTTYFLPHNRALYDIVSKTVVVEF